MIYGVWVTGGFKDGWLLESEGNFFQTDDLGEAHSVAKRVTCDGIKAHVERFLEGTSFPAEDPVRQDIKDLIKRGSVTHEEVQALRGNSWEWEALIPALTNDALIKWTEHNLKNCGGSSRRPCITYNESLQSVITPELLRRLAGMENLLKALEASIDGIAN